MTNPAATTARLAKKVTATQLRALVALAVDGAEFTQDWYGHGVSLMVDGKEAASRMNCASLESLTDRGMLTLATSDREWTWTAPVSRAGLTRWTITDLGREVLALRS